jgi:hypothetical protein
MNRKEYPLSNAQQRIWLIEQMDPCRPAFMMTAALRVEGRLEFEGLCKAVQQIAQRHESLRTTFHATPSGAIQRAHSEMPIDLKEIQAVEPLDLQAISREEALVGFDLSAGPLLRIRLLHNFDGEQVVLICAHHLITDEWSFNIFCAELAMAYRGWAEDLPAPPQAPAMQFGEYASRELRSLPPGRRATLEQYWERQLGGLQRLPLRTDYPRTSFRTGETGFEDIIFSNDVCKKLMDVGKSAGASSFMALVALFQLVLHLETGAQEIPIGTAVANRLDLDTHQTIGFFANTVVLRTHLDRDITFRDLLARVRNVVLGALAHQELPFDAVVERLNPPRELGRMPFYDVWCVMNPLIPPLSVPGATLFREPIGTPGVRCDLRLAGWETDGGIQVTTEYDTDLFDPATIQRVCAQLNLVAREASAYPDATISQLRLRLETRQSDLTAMNTAARSGLLSAKRANARPTGEIL